MTVAEHLFSTTLPLSFYGLHAGKSEHRADTSSSALPSTFPTPHAAQQRILDSTVRYQVANCGRRTGKTELAKRLLAEGALKGERVAYCAPTYPMAHQFYRELHDALAPLVTGKQSQRRLDIVGGGFIDIWSLENGGDRIRGQKYHRLVMDECAMVIGLNHVWEKVIRPTLTDYQGRAWFLSTPRRGSDFERFYRKGLSDGTEWQSWHFVTSDNPIILPEEIAAAKAEMSEAAFRQEYLAEFEASESDLVYPEFDDLLHVKPAPATWEQCQWRVVGIDPGGGDPTAIVPLGVSGNGHIHQYGEFYRRGDVAFDDVIGYIATLGKLDAIVIDPSAKGWVAQLQRYGYPAFEADNKRDTGLEAVRWLLGNGRLTIGRECHNSIAEFVGYRWAKRRDGDTGERYATSSAVDHHADAMDARRYAVMAILNGIQSGPRKPVRMERR